MTGGDAVPVAVGIGIPPGLPLLVVGVVGGQLVAAQRAGVADGEPRQDAGVVVEVRARQPPGPLAGLDAVLAHRALRAAPGRVHHRREALHGGFRRRAPALGRGLVPRLRGQLPEQHVVVVVGAAVEEVRLDAAAADDAGVVDVLVDDEAAQAAGGEEHLPLEAPRRGGLGLLLVAPGGDLLPLVGVAEREVPALVGVVLLQLQAVPAERQAGIVRRRPRPVGAVVLVVEVEAEERRGGVLPGGDAAVHAAGREEGRVGVGVGEEGGEGRPEGGEGEGGGGGGGGVVVAGEREEEVVGERIIAIGGRAAAQRQGGGGVGTFALPVLLALPLFA
uniref:Uncharacterized protein n=1 Tax=Triticum urartu TaxID=4572 RepID=A0A8R7QSV7_TRIUA